MTDHLDKTRVCFHCALYHICYLSCSLAAILERGYPINHGRKFDNMYGTRWIWIAVANSCYTYTAPELDDEECVK